MSLPTEARALLTAGDLYATLSTAPLRRALRALYDAATEHLGDSGQATTLKLANALTDAENALKDTSPPSAAILAAMRGNSGGGNGR